MSTEMDSAKQQRNDSLVTTKQPDGNIKYIKSLWLLLNTDKNIA